MLPSPSRIITMSDSAELVKALYPYNGEGQAVPLPFAETAILLVAERTKDGWCRGFTSGREGWFPGSYVKTLDNAGLVQKGIQPEALAAVLRSPDWLAYTTTEEKVYYVNTRTQVTTWELPALSPLQPTQASSVVAVLTKQTAPQTGAAQKASSEKLKKPKYQISNGLTFLLNGPEQPSLDPAQTSYVDHFWTDKGDQTGFDIILEKHLNGKFAMKDMMEFFRERAAVEEQYAKSLLKLSRSTLGDQEEGSVGRAWQSLKAELRYRSESHSKLAGELLKEMEKPLFEYKESQKKGRKEHQQIMEKSRKQLQMLDTSIEKTRTVFGGGKGKAVRKGSRDVEPGIGRRRSSATGDDLKKMEESYNHAQRQWVDNMINACQDFQKCEEERSDFLRNHFLKYVDLSVAVDEASAESLSRVTDAIDRINKKADREYFIKVRGTGTTRPVDRIVEI